MDSRAQKISLLSQMIAFALVDGELHDKEYDFLLLIANEMQIEKPAFLDLFRKRDEFIPIKDEFQRILHFYRLALLMNCDGVLHSSESNAIHEIGIKMGLNPSAMNRILELMKTSPDKMIAPEKVICAFQEQYN
jgi:uncharacterized tellurite resistance protein B-like protein